MNRRTSFVLTSVAMMLSATLVMAQGSTPTAAGTAARGAKVAAGATQAKVAASATQAKVATSATQAKVATSATQAKVATSATRAKVATSATQARSSAGSLVDLNTASKADLMKLPGVGEAISAKIIAGRPWANKSQLLAKGLVSKPAYEKLSPLVVARQGAATK